MDIFVYIPSRNRMIVSVWPNFRKLCSVVWWSLYRRMIDNMNKSGYSPT